MPKKEYEKKNKFEKNPEPKSIWKKKQNKYEINPEQKKENREKMQTKN